MSCKQIEVVAATSTPALDNNHLFRQLNKQESILNKPWATDLLDGGNELLRASSTKNTRVDISELRKVKPLAASNALASSKTISKHVRQTSQQQSSRKFHVRFDDYLDLNEYNMRRSCKRLMRHLYEPSINSALNISSVDCLTNGADVRFDEEDEDEYYSDECDENSNEKGEKKNNSESQLSKPATESSERTRKIMNLEEYLVSQKCKSKIDKDMRNKTDQVSNVKQTSKQSEVALSHKLSKEKFFKALARESEINNAKKLAMQHQNISHRAAQVSPNYNQIQMVSNTNKQSSLSSNKKLQEDKSKNYGANEVNDTLIQTNSSHRRSCLSKQLMQDHEIVNDTENENENEEKDCDSLVGVYQSLLEARGINPCDGTLCSSIKLAKDNIHNSCSKQEIKFDSTTTVSTRIQSNIGLGGTCINDEDCLATSQSCGALLDNDCASDIHDDLKRSKFEINVELPVSASADVKNTNPNPDSGFGQLTVLDDNAESVEKQAVIADTRIKTVDDANSCINVNGLLASNCETVDDEERCLNLRSRLRPEATNAADLQRQLRHWTTGNEKHLLFMTPIEQMRLWKRLGSYSSSLQLNANFNLKTSSPDSGAFLVPRRHRSLESLCANEFAASLYDQMNAGNSGLLKNASTDRNCLRFGTELPPLVGFCHSSISQNSSAQNSPTAIPDLNFERLDSVPTDNLKSKQRPVLFRGETDASSNSSSSGFCCTASRSPSTSSASSSSSSASFGLQARVKFTTTNVSEQQQQQEFIKCYEQENHHRSVSSKIGQAIMKSTTATVVDNTQYSTAVCCHDATTNIINARQKQPSGACSALIASSCDLTQHATGENSASGLYENDSATIHPEAKTTTTTTATNNNTTYDCARAHFGYALAAATAKLTTLQLVATKASQFDQDDHHSSLSAANNYSVYKSTVEALPVLALQAKSRQTMQLDMSTTTTTATQNNGANSSSKNCSSSLSSSSSSSSNSSSSNSGGFVSQRKRVATITSPSTRTLKISSNTRTRHASDASQRQVACNLTIGPDNLLQPSYLNQQNQQPSPPTLPLPPLPPKSGSLLRKFGSFMSKAFSTTQNQRLTKVDEQSDSLTNSPTSLVNLRKPEKPEILLTATAKSASITDDDEQQLYVNNFFARSKLASNQTSSSACLLGSVNQKDNTSCLTLQGADLVILPPKQTNKTSHRQVSRESKRGAKLNGNLDVIALSRTRKQRSRSSCAHVGARTNNQRACNDSRRGHHRHERRHDRHYHHNHDKTLERNSLARKRSQSSSDMSSIFSSSFSSYSSSASSPSSSSSSSLSLKSVSSYMQADNGCNKPSAKRSCSNRKEREKGRQETKTNHNKHNRSRLSSRYSPDCVSKSIQVHNIGNKSIALASSYQAVNGNDISMFQSKSTPTLESSDTCNSNEKLQRTCKNASLKSSSKHQRNSNLYSIDNKSRSSKHSKDDIYFALRTKNSSKLTKHVDDKQYPDMSLYDNLNITTCRQNIKHTKQQQLKVKIETNNVGPESVWGQIIEINKADFSQVIELERDTKLLSWGFSVAKATINGSKGIMISRFHDEKISNELKGLLSVGDLILSIDDVIIESTFSAKQVQQMINDKNKLKISLKPFSDN